MSKRLPKWQLRTRRQTHLGEVATQRATQLVSLGKLQRQLQIQLKTSAAIQCFNQHLFPVVLGEQLYLGIRFAMRGHRTEYQTIAVIVVLGGSNGHAMIVLDLRHLWGSLGNGLFFRFLGCWIEPRVNRVEQGVLRQATLLVARGQQPDRNRLTATYSDSRGGTMAEVEHPMLGATVVDFHNHLHAIVFICHHHIGAHLYFPMGCSEAVLVENLAIGGLATLETVVVEGALVVVLADGIGQRKHLCASR